MERKLLSQIHQDNNSNFFESKNPVTHNDWIFLSENFLFSNLQHNSLLYNHLHRLRCFRYVKDTKMKANHNRQVGIEPTGRDVSDMSKILK